MTRAMQLVKMKILNALINPPAFCIRTRTHSRTLYHDGCSDKYFSSRENAFRQTLSAARKRLFRTFSGTKQMHCAQCCLATTLCARGFIWTGERKLSRGSELCQPPIEPTRRAPFSVIKFNNSAYSQTNIYFGSVFDYHFTLRAFRKRLIKHFHLHFLLCGFIFYPAH